MPHIAHAFRWLRRRRCIYSFWPAELIRLSLDASGLRHLFDEAGLISAENSRYGKSFHDLLLHTAVQIGVAPSKCVVVEHSAAGVAAAVAVGMTAVGFVGGTHANMNLSEQLMKAGAAATVADMRLLRRTLDRIQGDYVANGI